MRKLYIIDCFNYKFSHEMFNAGFLNVCQFIFDDIQYFASKGSIKCVQDILKKTTTINFFPVPIVGGKSKFIRPLRFLVAALFDIVLLFFTKKEAVVVYNFTNVFSVSLVNTVNKILQRKIIMICHGEFELLNKHTSQHFGLFAKVVKRQTEIFYMNNNIDIAKYLYFIVLGDRILSNLKNLLPKNIYEKMFSIDLPYIYNFQKNKNMDSHTTLNLGTVGMVGKNKSIDGLIYLANIFNQEIKHGIMDFSITGHVMVKKQELLEAGINIPEKDNELDRQTFNKRVEQLDYILFFYEAENYRYTASGAIFDAINYEKPIISLKNDYFEYLFEKFYPMGYLVNSAEEMVPIIRNLLVNRHKNEYPFKKIKKELSLDTISFQFKKILEDIYFI